MDSDRNINFERALVDKLNTFSLEKKIEWLVETIIGMKASIDWLFENKVTKRTSNPNIPKNIEEQINRYENIGEEYE